MGIKWNQKRINTMDDGNEIHTVIYATPMIEWPANWAWKDHVISDSGVHPLARESVYRTMHRLVSKVIIRDNQGHVLLGKVLRGHFKGFWTLPGGYLDYSEHPRIGAIREAYEEMGIDMPQGSQEPRPQAQHALCRDILHHDPRELKLWKSKLMF